MSNNDERTEIINKLSNYLKLPKAQRWICCEWFYSDIDKVIFESENDFSLCIKQSFPRLKTLNLKRKQWCILRSLIGKPRRCSDAFFQEERLMLEEKRQKIRLIQQRKVSEKELDDFKDLPQEIPVTLSIGHRVYSHICSPEEGVFLGTIAAVDPCEHTYRVVFDRASLGSQTVFDYEIKSVNPIQTIPIKAYVQTYRPKASTNQTHQSMLMMTPHKSNLLLTPSSNDELNVNNPAFAAALLLQSNMDPMFGIGSPFKLENLGDLNSQFQTPLHLGTGIIPTTNNENNLSNNLNGGTTGILGGFPIRLLLMITRLNKIINIKKEYVTKLSALNTEAERLKANNISFSKEFQMNYAIVVLDLEKLNKDLSEYLTGVQRYCEEFAPEFKLVTSAIASTKQEDEEDYEENEKLEKEKRSQFQQKATNLKKLDDLNKKFFTNSVSIVERLNTINCNNQINKNNLLEICDNLNKIDLNQKQKIKSTHLLKLITKFTCLLFQLREFVNSTNASAKSAAASASQALSKERKINRLDEENQEIFSSSSFECSSSSASSSSCSSPPMSSLSSHRNAASFLPFCNNLLNDSINDIKNNLSSQSNVLLFEDKIQINLNYIQSTLCQLNKLHAFKYELEENANIQQRVNIIDYENEQEDEEEDADDENEENNDFNQVQVNEDYDQSTEVDDEDTDTNNDDEEEIEKNFIQEDNLSDENENDIRTFNQNDSDNSDDSLSKQTSKYSPKKKLKPNKKTSKLVTANNKINKKNNSIRKRKEKKLNIVNKLKAKLCSNNQNNKINNNNATNANASNKKLHIGISI